ncbi:MAG: acyl-CoA thioesterase [Treponema sp.]|nr:acyl-CoA thioesterase [Treponema sp.]
MKCECSLRVRSYECDIYGHVNNANYLHYLEYARYEFLRDIDFDFPALTKADYGIYIARIEIDYKAPALTDDLLTLWTWPVKKGSASGVLAQEIRRGEALIVAARVTWALVNSRTGMPAKIPAQWDLPALRP